MSMFGEITSWENLLLAYRLAAKGKRGHANVAAFEYRLEDNLFELQKELQEHTFQPGRYDSFYIHEPKRRLISAAPFRDRVVHHALCNRIEPLFERSFIGDSYANRVGKGTHRALGRTQYFARRYRYCLQCDVVQFFPSVDHGRLRRTLRRKIHDPGVLWLCDQILNSGIGVLSDEYQMIWFPGDDLLAANRPRGLPIGNLTSQFWANVYLNAFDHFVYQELCCPAYLRYVDDFLLFSNDKCQLREWLSCIQERLAQLRLVIHPAAQPRPVEEGIGFLGFRIFPQRRNLKRKKGLYYQRKLHAMLQEYADGTLELEALTASVAGWSNHVRYANTIGLRKAILGGIVFPPIGE